MSTNIHLAKIRPNLLINFYEAMLKDGITRIINGPEGADCLA